MRDVAVIGCGRFGSLWAQILATEFSVCVFDVDSVKANSLNAGRVRAVDLATALKCETIFYAVPISQFESALVEHLPYINSQHSLVIDLLSVKSYPRDVFLRNLSKDAPAMLCHPIFGPDSVRAGGLAGQKIVVDKFQSSDRQVSFWVSFFERRSFEVVQMSADDHDRLAARSQGLAHYVGRILGGLDIGPTGIDTRGASTLYELKDQVCNDSSELFRDLQTQNPFTLAMRVELAKVQTQIFNQLIPNRIQKTRLVIGIQGGQGSFNEQAIHYYLGRAGVDDYELNHLFTTEAVLRALHEGVVDRGQFAIHNSLGGVVTESIEAMANYNFSIIEEYSIKISHALMIRADATFDKVDTVMTHPQVLRQCANNLSQKYSRLRLTSGQGDMIDHAKVAQMLSKKQIEPNVATIGSKRLAQMFNLKIVEDELQDLRDNFTSFLFVQRPE